MSNNLVVNTLFFIWVSYQYNTVKIANAPIGQQIIFVLSAVILHHLVLFSLEAGSWTYWLLVLKSTLITSLLSTVLILTAFQFFNRKNT